MHPTGHPTSCVNCIAAGASCTWDIVDSQLLRDQYQCNRCDQHEIHCGGGRGHQIMARWMADVRLWNNRGNAPLPPQHTPTTPPVASTSCTNPRIKTPPITTPPESIHTPDNTPPPSPPAISSEFNFSPPKTQKNFIHKTNTKNQNKRPKLKKTFQNQHFFPRKPSPIIVPDSPVDVKPNLNTTVEDLIETPPASPLPEFNHPFVSTPEKTVNPTSAPVPSTSIPNDSSSTEPSTSITYPSITRDRIDAFEAEFKNLYTSIWFARNLSQAEEFMQVGGIPKMISPRDPTIALTETIFNLLSSHWKIYTSNVQLKGSIGDSAPNTLPLATHSRPSDTSVPGMFCLLHFFPPSTLSRANFLYSKTLIVHCIPNLNIHPHQWRLQPFSSLSFSIQPSGHRGHITSFPLYTLQAHVMKPSGPYIGSKYQRMHPSNPLPSPTVPGRVGLACPMCTVNISLIYVSGGVDTVKVKCPTSDHYYRTFKLNQLNHELARINAGDKYPIPYNALLHGPPVNIKGEVVTEQVSPKNSPPSASQRSQRAAPSQLCARPREGPTAEKHKSAGHTGCTQKYCKACCHAYGPPGKCYVHRIAPEPKQAATSTPSNTSTTTHAPLPTAPQPKRARIIPEQCAQSVRYTGHVLTEDRELVLSNAKKLKQDMFRKALEPRLDPNKVVSLHLVTQPTTPVITQHFPTWPTVALDECESLWREAKAAAGLSWNGHILVWDEQLKNWVGIFGLPPHRLQIDPFLDCSQRDIALTLPHQYPRTTRNLVLCLPSQRITLANDLQAVLERFGLGKPYIPKAPVQLATVPKVEPASPPPLAKPFAGTSQQPIEVLNSKTDSDLDLHDWPELDIALTVSPTLSGEASSDNVIPDLFRHLDPALMGNMAAQNLEADEKPFNSSNNAPVLNDWPGEDAMTFTLLAWHLAVGMPAPRKRRIPCWIEFFGTEYQLEEQTVYRYAHWVGKVTYPRFKAWLDSWPEEGEKNRYNITIVEARRHFQAEFLVVSGLKQPGDPTAPRKRKERQAPRPSKRRRTKQ
ncbi:uncharacterized protein MELLADRAFT_85334 [Melampsora larici-populina 98AG31]|uniref:Uncharacterized protein n=1 Tax=Melampsora larici-populina (strain 98AG31 / pathotype 3-4-7) TaxID=747676 RepID=F4SD04_MELLP|nr:uncharacterized protein MELLADRAFT_85334 [Melampsora larici-populina 98AG31]EGF97475.1 hypothetical protein MELLADRAFT_85334 [Melampsora larici-populina 98AG31]